MVSGSEYTKTIRVSEGTHEELAIRKHRNESFDDVLKRELGLVPETINELTRRLPPRLSRATNLIVTGHVNKQDQFKPIYDAEVEGEDEGHVVEETLQFVSQNTNRVIYEVNVYYPSSERKNHRVDFQYRNSTNTLERVLSLRDITEGEIEIEWKNPETGDRTSNTRASDNPGETTADDFGEEVEKFVDQALNRWA